MNDPQTQTALAVLEQALRNRRIEGKRVVSDADIPMTLRALVSLIDARIVARETRLATLHTALPATLPPVGEVRVSVAVDPSGVP